MKRIPYQTDQNNPQIKAYKDAVDRGMKNHHVMLRDNNWVVKRAGAKRPIGVFTTQQEAIIEATSIAKNQGTAVFIHGQNGRIRDRREY
jgi:hypothetical protein